MDELMIFKYFLIVCISFIPLGRTQELQPHTGIDIQVENTIEEGASITAVCQVSNPGPVKGIFAWVHLNAKDESNIFVAGSDNAAHPRVTVTSASDTASEFVMTNVSTTDSGIISCHYTYYETGNNMSVTIQARKSLCVASQPPQPICKLEQSGFGNAVALTCIVENVCPTDVTLRWYVVEFDAMHEFIGNVSKDTSVVENKISTMKSNTTARHFTCALESILYPNVHLNCSISQHPVGIPRLLTTTMEPSSSFSTSRSLLPTTTENKPHIPFTTSSPDAISANRNSRSPALLATTNEIKSASKSTVTSTTRSSDWAIYTTILFAIVACFAIGLNVYLGFRLYKLNGFSDEQIPVTSLNAAPGSEQQKQEQQESYMDLDLIDEPNKAYMALKTDRGLQAVPDYDVPRSSTQEGTDYEVPLPDTQNERQQNDRQCTDFEDKPYADRIEALNV